jgi:hypothetical protein
MRAHPKNGEPQRLGKSRMASIVVITGKLANRPGRRGPAESQTQSQRVGADGSRATSFVVEGIILRWGERICPGP